MYIHLKRCLDFVMALVGMILLSPLFLILMIAIKLDSKGPILFRQKRIGIHKTHFHILKFRTMRIDTPKDMPTHLLQNPEQYITKVGKFLRKTSLDELPQLFNVLKGEMTLVGPRPPLPSEVAHYTSYEEMRLSVTPGLTCVWQVQPKRDEIRFADWVDMDLKYIGTRSIWLDLWLVFRTVLVVIRSSGS